MATREMQLISRIIVSGELGSVIDWGITAEDFLTSEGRGLFNHIMGYFSRPDTGGAVLGPQAIQMVYPNFVRCDDPQMTTEALCLEVRSQRLAIAGQNKLDEVRLMFGSNPAEAIRMLQATSTELSNIGYGRNTDLSFGTALQSIYREYGLLRSGITMSCGQWPWEVMNDVTMGFQPDDYIVLYGRPKSFKSWMLAYIIASVFDQGKRGLIYTKEMTGENIFKRITACIAQIDYQNLRRGRLSPMEEQAFYQAGHFIELTGGTQQLYCLSGQDAPEGGDTVPWLRSKIEKYRPDFVFVDGMYLMSDVRKAKKDNVRVQNISRDLRQMILHLKIPVIATIQANRAAAKNQEANLDEIAFSDSISQDATCIIRVINEKNNPTCQMVLGGAREYHLNGFRVNRVPAYDFSYYGPLTSKEIEKAKAEDAKPEDDTSAHAKPQRKPQSAAAVAHAEAAALRGFSNRLPGTVA